MVLTFAGRKRGEIPMHGGVARVWELLAEALQHLVQKVYITHITIVELYRSIRTHEDHQNSKESYSD
jgi:hypothetical protein